LCKPAYTSQPADSFVSWLKRLFIFFPLDRLASFFKKIKILIYHFWFLNNELNKNFTDENNIESPTYESFDEPTLPSNDDFSSNEEPPPLNNFSLTSNKLLHHFLNQKLYHKPLPNSLNTDHNNFAQSTTKTIID